MEHALLRRIVIALIGAFVAAVLILKIPLTAQSRPAEVRAMWVVRTTLTSPASIAAMVSAAKAGGFNTLLVQVRGRGDAYFQSGVEPRPPSLDGQPAFDPLAEAIERAHEAGLKVHAWINVNLVAGAAELPSARDHIVYRHPEWLMVPRALGSDLIAVDPRSPEYLGRLTRYVRSQSNELEGLYVSPVPAAAAAYTTSVVRDIAVRYDIDGIHLDYIRYPREDFDFSRATLAAFRTSLDADLTPEQRRRYDGRAAAGEPLIYTAAFPERWRAFRVARLTALATSLRDMLKTVKPGALVSVAVVPNADEAAAERLQDWRQWLDRGLVDVVCPMAYTADAALFATQIATARDIAGAHPVWAGIGAYRLSRDRIVDNVQTARRLGVDGVILFSYDSLADPAHGPGYVAQVGRAAFMAGTH
jgi:uncharacterized lipoprotein YddW (UPF0748 family)